jgi:hypothetical protein
MIANMLRITATVLLVSSSAAAEPVEEFGTKGHFILSVDRLFPLISYTRIRTAGNMQGEYNTTSQTSMSLLWSGQPQDFYDIPRVGLDYVIAPQLTLGGSIFATLPMSSSSERTMNGMTTTRDSTKESAFGIGARVGYVVHLTPAVSFWPRGGLSYSHVTTTDYDPAGVQQGSQTTTQPALNLEPLFVISPAPHFGIVLGPVFDIPLGGNEHTEIVGGMGGGTLSFDTDASQLHIGITVAMLGWF